MAKVFRDTLLGWVDYEAVYQRNQDVKALSDPKTQLNPTHLTPPFRCTCTYLSKHPPCHSSRTWHTPLPAIGSFQGQNRLM